MARAEAVRRNLPVNFTLGTGSSWTVGCVTATTTCPAAIQSRATGDGSSSAITVTAADASTITFNNFGRMTAPAPASGATKFDVTVDSSVLSAASTRNLRVTVGVSGNVRMCDPNVAAATPPDPRAC
jgi:type IV fimbrial biogenesis protein FimT